MKNFLKRNHNLQHLSRDHQIIFFPFVDKRSSHSIFQNIFFCQRGFFFFFAWLYLEQIPSCLRTFVDKGSSHYIVQFCLFCFVFFCFVLFFFLPFAVLAHAGQELHQISSIISFQEFAVDRPNPQSILINNFVSSVGVEFLNHIRAIPFGEEFVAPILTILKTLVERWGDDTIFMYPWSSK